MNRERMILTMLKPASKMPFVILVLAFAAAAESSPQSLALPGCPDTCGNLTHIPFPFGIGPNCFLAPQYEIDCQQTRGIYTPVLKNLSAFILPTKVSQPIFYSHPNCTANQQNDPPVDLVHNNGTFFYSRHRNYFVAKGCDSLALMVSAEAVVGCNCSSKSESSRCFNGTTCCFTSIPNQITSYSVEFQTLNGRAIATGGAGCSYAFLVEEAWWLNTDFYSLLPSAVPVVLEWGINSDDFELLSNRNHTGSSGGCFWDLSPMTVYCSCNEGYKGNYYLPEECQDVDECKEDPYINCRGKCVNRPGSYTCIDYKIITIIGVSTGIGAIALPLLSWGLYKFIVRRRVAKLKRQFFKRNGGLLLQQHLSSIEDSHVDKGKLFTSMEIDMATDHFNENQILGRGGQGTVYKGMLLDGMIIAVKKSKSVDVGQVEQFVNEVVILSQINHRNVVKLLGFCLESEVLLLVYEFVPNGTLYRYLHDPDEEFPLLWEIRLRIANESSNILLDEKYQAKVADFGASKSLSIDQTHLTTMVRGTFGYLDPEYYQTSQFTDKSDVYSFGVVLAELLTGEKPISQLRAEEDRNLASYFVISMEENRLFDVLDKEVLDHGEQEEIIVVSNLVKRCLNPNGRYRPTMKEVAMELEQVQSQRNPTDFRQNEEEIDRIRTGSIHASGAIPMLMRSGAEVELTSMEEDQSLLSPR
ncbi:hypothetical protein ACJRO7_002058 [Eucalyptus globulus]|uniref:Protein kinase domain-containing protein n=1 Tax=Eucalyptus globulus TaxID=34317 RepID=A0ABD3LT13_EUCGL